MNNSVIMPHKICTDFVGQPFIQNVFFSQIYYIYNLSNYLIPRESPPGQFLFSYFHSNPLTYILPQLPNQPSSNHNHSGVFSHRPFIPQNHQHRLPQYLNIQPQVPLRDILVIQCHNLFKIRNIASSAHLPHPGQTWFD